MKKKWIMIALAVCAIVLAGCKVVSEPEPVAVESVTLNTKTLTLAPGVTRKLKATVKPDNADDKTVKWSSSDEAVAMVSSDGTVGTIKAGTAIITAQAGEKTAICVVTVNDAAVTNPDAPVENPDSPVVDPDSPVAVERVMISATTLTIEPGKTRELKATVTPSNVENKTVTWSSSDETIATVSDDGTVTAHAEGTAIITARAGDKEAACTVTVKTILIPVECVSLNTTTLTLLRDETGKLTATVTPSNADDTSVAWSSSNDEVATVDNDGTVTTVKAGEATITAQAGEITAECAVTVNPILVESITLDVPTLTLAPDMTRKLTATVTPKNADDMTVAWSSSNTDVATVGNDGTITAHMVGTTNITVTTQDGGKTAKCVVTVHTDHSYRGGKCTLCGAKPYLEGGTIDEKGVLTKYSGYAATVIIPDGVTGIGDKAFYNNRSLTNVTIPDSVTSIGSSAFSECMNLTSVTIPDSVTSIGSSAFSECTGLTSVRYGGTLADWCSITWDNYDANPLYYGKAVLYIGNEAVRDAVIPNSVTEIKDYAFYGCTNLKSVTIPNSVTSIGNYAFNGCKSLVQVNIPNSVTSIKSYVFGNCGLTSVNIPSSITSIEDHAFSRCNNLTDVTIHSTTSIGHYAFAFCSNLKEVKYDGTLAQWCAKGGGCLTMYAQNITLNDVGNLMTLTNLVIPSGVTSIVNSAFHGCTKLTSVTIPDSVTSIKGNAFYECTSLTSVKIGNGVTSIGNGAFYGCTKLTGVTIPDSVTSIGGSAFYECTSLTSVKIGNGVTSIGNGAFHGCTKLTGVTIPDSVTSIGSSAFYGCTSLKSVTIPVSVTSIKDNAFFSCNSLTIVNYAGTENQWNDIEKGSFFFGFSKKTITGKDDSGNVKTWDSY